MSKKIILSLLSVFMLTACEDKKKYIVTAIFPDSFDGKKAYLHDPAIGDGEALDSALIHDGKCVFEGQLTDTAVIRIVKYGADTYPATFITEEGNIKITINPKNNMPSVHGTPLNDTYQNYMDEVDNIFAEMRKVFNKRDSLVYANKLDEQQNTRIAKQEAGLLDNMENLAYNYIRSNTNNILGKIGFFTESQYLSPKKIEDLLPLFDDDFRNKAAVREKELLVRSRLQTDTGSVYNDITGTTPDGKQLYLSEYIDKKEVKVIVVDFWASWSGPCSASIPQLKTLYDKYKAKGLVIIGVSLDYDKQNWLAAIKSFKMDWPQMSTLGGWNEPAAAIYGIANIPEQIVINKKGIIVARELNERELQNKIEELIKQ